MACCQRECFSRNFCLMSFLTLPLTFLSPAGSVLASAPNKSAARLQPPG